MFVGGDSSSFTFIFSLLYKSIKLFYSDGIMMFEHCQAMEQFQTHKKQMKLESGNNFARFLEV